MKNVSRESSKGYIIDNYSPYYKNENVVSTFKIHGISYCVREIDTFDWGQPVFPEKDINDNYGWYHVYNSLNEAMEYVKYLKRLEGSRI